MSSLFLCDTYRLLNEVFILFLCTVFLLNAAVFADLALYLSVGGLASVELSLLSYHTRASSTSGTNSSAAYLCCVDLFTLSFSLKLVCCQLEISNIVLGDCAASVNCAAVCSRSGIGMFWTLAVSHHLGHLCLSLHLWSHRRFLRDLRSLPETLRHHIDMKFPGSSFHQGHLSCRTRDANFCGFSHCNHTLLVQLSV